MESAVAPALSTEAAVIMLIVITSLPAIAPIPASAAEMMDCTDANMMKANAVVDKMAAGEKKTTGMNEMTLAKTMMEKQDVIGCKLHLNKAIEIGMSK